MADPAYIVDSVLTDGEAWVGITTTTLGASATTVTFTSTDDGQVGDFSQYMDLVLISYVRGDRAQTGDLMCIQFNNDTTSSYQTQYVAGSGSSASAYPNLGTYGYMAYPPAASAAANIFGAVVTHISDINSGKYKSMITSEAADQDGSGEVGLYAVTWQNQAPITEIDWILPLASSDFVAGSMFSLFGVLPRMVA